jgi:RNA polymerase sigma-70 factor (ECF subfamily)
MSDVVASDHEVFLQQFMRHERSVRAYARTLLSSWEDVDEVMQEASLVAWRKYATFDAATSFGAWLATIVRFEALKLRRTKLRDRLVFSEETVRLLEQEGLNDLERLEHQRTALQRCLDKLNETQRRLLRVSYCSGQKLHEVARESGLSLEAFYKALQRLRAALLKCAKRELQQEANR